MYHRQTYCCQVYHHCSLLFYNNLDLSAVGNVSSEFGIEVNRTLSNLSLEGKISHLVDVGITKDCNTID